MSEEKTLQQKYDDMSKFVAENIVTWMISTSKICELERIVVDMKPFVPIPTIKEINIYFKNAHGKGIDELAGDDIVKHFENNIDALMEAFEEKVKQKENNVKST